MQFLKSPVARFQPYGRLLQTVLKRSDCSNPRHKCEELSQFLSVLKTATHKLDGQIHLSQLKVDTINLRANIVSNRLDYLFPEQGSEIAYRATILLRPNRSRFSTSSRAPGQEAEVVVFSRPFLKILIIVENGRRGMINQPLLEAVIDVSKYLRRFSLDAYANKLPIAKGTTMAFVRARYNAKCRRLLCR